MLFKVCLKGILHWNFSLRKEEVDSASYINHIYEHFMTLCFRLISVTLLDPLTRVNELEKPLIIQDLSWLKLTLWSCLSLLLHKGYTFMTSNRQKNWQIGIRVVTPPPLTLLNPKYIFLSKIVFLLHDYTNPV